jgi:uncharacterized lipoprotein YmbA
MVFVLKIHRQRFRPLLFVAALCVSAATPGCFDLQRAYPEKRFYALSAERPDAPAHRAAERPEPRFPEALKIGRFRVSPRFASRGLVYRTSDVVFETDFYNEFLTAAATNITEETRRWLGRGDLFARVVDLTSQVDSCFILEAHVNEIYADLRQAPESIMEVQFILLRYGDTVLFERTYDASTPAASADGADLVRAHNRSLVTVLGKLEADLRQLKLPACQPVE